MADRSHTPSPIAACSDEGFADVTGHMFLESPIRVAHSDNDISPTSTPLLPMYIGTAPSPLSLFTVRKNISPIPAFAFIWSI
jgi:hypothetical protein